MRPRGMTSERRSETPVNDTKLRTEVSVSIVIQGLILIGIVSMTSIMFGMRIDMAASAEVQQMMMTTIQDHEIRIRTTESEISRIQHHRGLAK
jgi:hypothetical protein